MTPRRANGRGRDTGMLVPMPDKLCSIDGCGRPVRTRGWCQRHYTRWHRTGHPLGSKPRPGADERFDAKVDRSGDCHIWLGARMPFGYGKFGRTYAHRFAYERANGPIPPDHQIDHLCRNPPCVNPDHLEAVTPAENVRRMLPYREVATQCPNGHPYEGDNLFVNKHGARECKTCRKDAQRRHWAKESHAEILRLRDENERLRALLSDAQRGA